MTETANSIFSRKGIENFQLCASLLSFLLPTIYSTKTKYFLLIHGHDGNQSKKLPLNCTYRETINCPDVLSLRCEAFYLDHREIIEDLILSYNVIPHPLDEHVFFMHINYQKRLRCVRVMLDAEN